MRKILAAFKPLTESISTLGLVLNTGLLVVASILELFGLMAVLFFIRLIVSPKEIQEVAFAKFETIVGINLAPDNITNIIALIILLYFGGASARLVVQYLIFKLAMKIEQEMCVGLLNYNLSQPYDRHSNSHSSEFMRNVLQDSSLLTAGFIIPVLTLAANALTLIGLFILSYYTVGILSYYFILFVMLIIILFYLSARSSLKKLGRDKAIASSYRYEVLTNIARSLKNIYIENTQSSVIAEFSNANRPYTISQSKFLTISSFFAIGIEIFIVGMLIVLVAWFNTNLLSGESVPSLAVGLVLASRFLPNVLRLYQSYSTVTYQLPLATELASKIASNVHFSESGIIRDFQKLEIKKLKYVLPKSKRPLLNISGFVLNKGDKVLITGPSGSGKSTLLDVITGINLTPAEIFYNDKILNSKDDYRDFRFNISYVSQNAILNRGTIVDVVCFGAPFDKIKFDLIAGTVGLNSLLSENEDFASRDIGENGALLSGGQKQRLVLAKALYAKRSLLILDEATSALDELSSTKIFKSLAKNFPNLTMLVISHGSNYKGFNRILELGNCELKELPIAN